MVTKKAKPIRDAIDKFFINLGVEEILPITLIILILIAVLNILYSAILGLSSGIDGGMVPFNELYPFSLKIYLISFIIIMEVVFIILTISRKNTKDSIIQRTVVNKTMGASISLMLIGLSSILLSTCILWLIGIVSVILIWLGANALITKLFGRKK